MRDPSRRAVLAAAALALAPAARAACAPARVLFVCRYGTVKSPIAREHLRRRAAARGLRVHAMARGLTPQDHLTPALAAQLGADRISARREPVQPLTARDLEDADVVVSFDRPAPPGARDWSDLPSMTADYPLARADLLRRIDRLLSELAARRC